MNRDLNEEKSEIIKNDFINPRWKSEVYTDGLVNKLLLFLSKKFNFLKNEIVKTLVSKTKIFFTKS